MIRRPSAALAALLLFSLAAAPSGKAGPIGVTGGPGGGPGGPPFQIVSDLRVVAGADAGGVPEVQVFDAGAAVQDYLAFPRAFPGGVRVAAADVNGDGIADVIAGPGHGGAPQLTTFNGSTGATLGSLFAFNQEFPGGIYVAGASNGWTAVGAGSGGAPEVKVFDASGSVVKVLGPNGAVPFDFLAFNPDFRGGVRVALADVNGDGVPDVIAGAGPGSPPRVSVFDGKTGQLLQSFLAYDDTFRGGVYVAGAAGKIVTGAGPGGAPEVKVFDAATGATLADFNAFPAPFKGGVRVAAADVNGVTNIVAGAGPGGPPVVNVFTLGGGLATAGSPAATGAPSGPGAGSGVGEGGSIFAFDPSFRGGVFVGAAASPLPPPPSAQPAVSVNVKITPAGGLFEYTEVFTNNTGGLISDLVVPFYDVPTDLASDPGRTVGLISPADAAYGLWLQTTQVLPGSNGLVTFADLANIPAGGAATLTFSSPYSPIEAPGGFLGTVTFGPVDPPTPNGPNSPFFADFAPEPGALALAAAGAIAALLRRRARRVRS
jgi:hypothetical protein